MKAENIAYIKETERHIEYSIAYETDRRAISRMNQALAYIHGSLKAAELGDERMAMCNLDKANYWMAQARDVSRRWGVGGTEDT